MSCCGRALLELAYGYAEEGDGRLSDTLGINVDILGQFGLLLCQFLGHVFASSLVDEQNLNLSDELKGNVFQPTCEHDEYRVNAP